MSGRALVTGGSGFVGRKLCAHLEKQGWKVVPTGYPSADGFLDCNVTDTASIARTFEAVGNVTHVFHLAALTFVPAAIKNPNASMVVNCLGTVNLVQVLAGLPSPPRLLYVGSSEVYGPPQALPITEDHPLNPANPYAITKTAADHYCAFAARAGTLDIVRMRPFNHSGAGQEANFVLSSFAKQVAEAEVGEGAVRTGNLDAARDFLHVDDVVRAYELAALKGVSGEAYNVCSGTARSIREALDTLLGIAHQPIEVHQDPERMRPVDVPEVAGSHDKLTAATGWQPRVPFESLLRELLDYWRRRVD